MNRIDVESSVVRAIGYEPATSRLEVAFVNGGVYRYHHVPAAVHAAFLAAESKGQFLNGVVKPNYPVAQVGPWG
ncbi:MAG: KTSC domain-containing protein [Acidobacteriota bacterium]